MSRFGVFLALVLATLPAFANDVTDLFLASACKANSVCSKEYREFLQKTQLKCEIEKKAQQCDELAKNHPTWVPLMRRCDTEGLCQQHQDYMREKQLACLRGYKNALVDLGISLKDMTVSLAGMVESGWESLKRNNKLRQEFLKECNQSLACKKDLVKNDHRYNTLSDEKLDKFPASFLYVEAQEAASYQASLDRYRPSAYVPVSEKFKDRELELTSDQQRKLSGLTAIVKEQVKKQYHRYSCYSELAQEELLCYSIGNVVDPFMIAGYFAKGARLATAAGRAAHLSEEARAAEALTAFKSKSFLLTRAQLVDKYLDYNPTTEAQNLAWIAKAKRGTDSEAKVFMSVENSKIRELNNTLNDKNLVTSLTNYHKEILDGKMEALQKEFPNLVIDKYSDFKSMRFAFSGKIPTDLEKRLQGVFKDANAEFTQYLSDAHLLRKSDKPQEWLRGGIGSSADQANVAARESRSRETNSLLNYSASDVKTALENDLRSQELTRQSLHRELGGTSLLNDVTVDKDVFDIVRKSSGNSAEIKTALEQRYTDVKLTPYQVKDIEKYVTLTDRFSPDVYIPKRESANLNDAIYGGFSADIAGMGANNLKATADALATSSSIDRALVATRRAEQEVTSAFNDQKKFLSTTLEKHLPGKTKSLCSGDDCVTIAVSPLTDVEKTRIVNELSNSRYTGKYRLSFIPEGVVQDESRNLMATHGESLEKILRKNLQGQISNSKLSNMTFGVDMRTRVANEGAIRLITGQNSKVNLTAKEQEAIQKAFSSAVQKFNAENASQGVSSTYFALPAP